MTGSIGRARPDAPKPISLEEAGLSNMLAELRKAEDGHLSVWLTGMPEDVNAFWGEMTGIHPMCVLTGLMQHKDGKLDYHIDVFPGDHQDAIVALFDTSPTRPKLSEIKAYRIKPEGNVPVYGPAS